MRNLLSFLLLLSILSCTQKEHNYTYYYWKTQLSLNDIEREALNKATTPILYTRFFDVDKIGGKIEPIAVLNKEKNLTIDKKIVPVVFITNRTFQKITTEQLEQLSSGIVTLIHEISKKNNLSLDPEIQIDCDWTQGTKKDYFHFLEVLKKKSNSRITSTLRLHQVRDRNIMGVPPVDKVYLMCYSTSSPLEDSNTNSILDNGLLKSYLQNLTSYPIKDIDVAFPIYSWAIITNHVGKHKLINGLSTSDLNHPNFEKISETIARVKEDGFYFGHFLNKGFTIKIEQISKEQLQEAQTILNKKRKHYNIIYYQLSSKFVENPIL